VRLFITIVVMPSLVLNETTLFYLNLSATGATASGNISSFNDVKNWTTHVAKSGHSTKPNSIHGASTKSSTLIPSKRTTTSSSAVVVAESESHAQPEAKKIKLDNRDASHATTSKFLEEDETVEREAALLSPIKGNQRLNSKVRHISHHGRMLTCRQEHCQGGKSVTTPTAQWS
jgi:hypothetical protein